MWRAVLIAIALVACQPKQPLQASFFNAEKAKHAPPKCGETLACYADCSPMTEECLLICDQKAAHPRQAELARAVTYCSAQHGCGDQACTDVKCAPEMQACTSGPLYAPASTRMAPQPYPGQAGGPSPTTPQPYPGQAASMPPPPPQAYRPPPPGYAPAPVMQPQPYPGQPGYRPPPPGYQPPPPSYRPPPPPPRYR